MEVENKIVDPIIFLDNSLKIENQNLTDTANVTNENNLQICSDTKLKKQTIRKKKLKPPREKKETKKSIRNKTCTLCNVFIKDLNEFMIHQEAHVTDSGFKCLTCEREFRKRPSLRHHSRAIHQGILFDCKLCNVTFKYQSNIRRHMQTIHNQENKFVCEYCGKSYAQLAALQEHFSCAHSGVKSFQCDICKKNFKSRFQIFNHMKYVHIKTVRTKRTTKQETKYARCPFCFKNFPTCYISIHLRIHKGIKPHSCDICGKGFRQNCHLTRHMLWHTGLKKHKCATCGKSFPTVTSLNIHNRYHTGEKRYKCLDCSAMFFVINDLKRHWKKEHPNIENKYEILQNDGNFIKKSL